MTNPLLKFRKKHFDTSPKNTSNKFSHEAHKDYQSWRKHQLNCNKNMTRTVSQLKQKHNNTKCRWRQSHSNSPCWEGSTVLSPYTGRGTSRLKLCEQSSESPISRNNSAFHNSGMCKQIVIHCPMANSSWTLTNIHNSIKGFQMYHAEVMAKFNLPPSWSKCL